MAMACTAGVASSSSFCAPLHASPSTRSSFFSGTSKLSINSSSSNGASLPAMVNTITIECSSRPQKKCTAHHNKSRPKKHNLSDKNRKPPVYPKPPPPPPIITLGWADGETPSVVAEA